PGDVWFKIHKQARLPPGYLLPRPRRVETAAQAPYSADAAGQQGVELAVVVYHMHLVLRVNIRQQRAVCGHREGGQILAARLPGGGEEPGFAYAPFRLDGHGVDHLRVALCALDQSAGAVNARKHIVVAWRELDF